MSVTFAYAADIVKSERDENGDLIVYGKATGPDLDLDGQICDPAWLKKAMPKWMTFGNIREMHQPIAAGIGVELTESGDDWWLKSICVDPNTATKIERGVLKGYSIGIKDGKVVKDAGAPGGRIVGGEVVETSYVDRPCNPTAKMAIAKIAKGGHDLEAVEAPETAEISGAPGGESPADDSVKGDGDQPAVSVTAEADEVTAADPGEDAPVATAESAEKALARGVGRTILNGLSTLKYHGKTPVITKAAPSADIDSAEACMSAIGALIQSEAQGLIDGMQCEAYQIECLLRAYNSLVYFCALESSEPDGETVDVIVLDAKADITKSAPEDPKPMTETVETETAASDDGTEVTALRKEVDGLRTQLAKVLATPVPGGPVLTRKAEDIEKADGRTALLAKAADYDRLALDMQAADPAAAAGYRALATAARTGL